MLPHCALPGPLPLTRSAARQLLASLDEYSTPAGAFLSFVQIAVEERIGEWRFAGAAETLAGAVLRIDAFGAALKLAEAEGAGYASQLLDALGECSSGRVAPIADIGPHRVIVCGQGEAPYDDFGLCIVELGSPTDSPYSGRTPETTPPEEWRESALEWIIEVGSERFGPPTEEAEEAIRSETRLAVWSIWWLEWERFDGWGQLLASG